MTYSTEEIRRTLGALGVTTREELHALIDADATPKEVVGIKGIEDARAPLVVWLRSLSEGDWYTYVGDAEAEPEKEEPEVLWPEGKLTDEG